MHSGLIDSITDFSKLKQLSCVSLLLLCFASCKEPAAEQADLTFKFPEQGQTFSLGEPVKVQLEVPKDEEIKKVSYLLDGKPIGEQGSPAEFTFGTDSLTLGYKLITAIIDHGAGKDSVTINIVLKSAVKPLNMTYKVLNTYPHDTSSYTQGLEYHNGRFLESTGEYGASTLRWVDLQTGKAIQRIDIEPKYFAEGSTLINDKIILLTWKENMGFVYDAKSLKQTGTFPYQNSREGWGLTYDGKRLIKSDGSNRIWFLNKDTYAEEGSIDVYDNNAEVNELNELEYINGKIYANIYQSDKIAVINPSNGVVEQYIDLSGILPAKDKFANTDVLNGIAWDAAGKRLFVTGKKFDKLFHIAVVPVK